MTARTLRIAASIAVPALILLLPIAVYLVDRAASYGEVPRNVSVVGMDVGGLSEDDAIIVVREYESSLKGQNAAFVVSESTYELDPMAVGLTADVTGAVDRIAPRNDVFALPVIGLIVWVANGFLGTALYRHERVASYIAWSGAAIVQVFFLLALWGIVT